MTTVGIICECNPMHGGHEYLIRRAKEGREVRVLCVMSGCFVQRGEAAIADPYLRAEALVRAGADAVVELPFPYAASGAEFFAQAGVEILSRLGADEIWFGSECGDITLLRRAAEVCESAEFQSLYAQSTADNSGTAEAYFDILQRLCGEGTPLLSNDILGIAYLRAIQKMNSRLRPVTVRRVGSAYGEQTVSKNGFPSATALRNAWREGGIEAILPKLPDACRDVYARAEHPIDLANAERLILGHFRLVLPKTLEQIAELSGGLSNRLQRAACEAQSFDEMLDLAATKKYPTARLRRGIVFALMGITPEALRTSPAYVRLLAANREGCRLLAEIRKTSDLAVVTRKADLPDVPAAEAQAEWERRAWALYGLCRADGAIFPSPWVHNPVILE